MIACVSRSINTHVFEYVYFQFIIQFVQFFSSSIICNYAERCVCFFFSWSLGACFGEVLKVLIYKYYNNKENSPRVWIAKYFW